MTCQAQAIKSLNVSRVHPSFFISKKVQVEWPEVDSGGNAQAFIVIFENGKLEIGSRRDFRDFAIFLATFGFHRDQTRDLWIQRPTRYPFGHECRGRSAKKISWYNSPL